MHRTFLVATGRLAGVATLLAASAAAAQTSKVYYACYVPSTGTIYRIKEADTPAQCGTSRRNGTEIRHIEFSWTAGGAGAGPSASAQVSESSAKGQGGGGAIDHGSLAGLTDDDHPQYLLTDGTRATTNGFAVAGSLGIGSIPAQGAGTRLMWYPAKGAFRAGTTISSEWDDANVGLHSVSMGYATSATGERAVSFGYAAHADGLQSVAFSGGNAIGARSVAFGGTAAGLRAVAIGDFAEASGDNSVVMGTGASSNGKKGAFVWADASGGSQVQAIANNQFVARAAQFWFGNNANVTSSLGRFIETSTGAYLSSGGAWTNTSDSTKKTGFRDVDGEQVLEKLAALPVRSWSYRSEDSTVRHIGPTAQEFHSAFALGDTDTAIATIDADGVSLAAIKALVERTKELDARNHTLSETIVSLQQQMDRLQADLVRLATSSSVTRD